VEEGVQHMGAGDLAATSGFSFMSCVVSTLAVGTLPVVGMCEKSLRTFFGQPL